MTLTAKHTKMVFYSYLWMARGQLHFDKDKTIFLNEKFFLLQTYCFNWLHFQYLKIIVVVTGGPRYIRSYKILKIRVYAIGN
jgi:hypothetical protein